MLVAGGLGERLGFSGIKIALPCETVTNTSFLMLYIQSILAIQSKAQKSGSSDLLLPFVIMTSDDTHTRTMDFLEQNKYFGMDKNQVQPRFLQIKSKFHCTGARFEAREGCLSGR